MHGTTADPILKRSIAFGLVNIPVALTSSESCPNSNVIWLNSRNFPCIRYKRVNAETGDDVRWGHGEGPGICDNDPFILLTQHDLSALQPQLTKTIEITELLDSNLLLEAQVKGNGVRSSFDELSPTMVANLMTTLTGWVARFLQ